MCVCVCSSAEYEHALDLYWCVPTSPCWAGTSGDQSASLNDWEHLRMLLQPQETMFTLCPLSRYPPCSDHKHIPAIDFPLTPSRLEASARPDTQTPTDWVQPEQPTSPVCSWTICLSFLLLLFLCPTFLLYVLLPVSCPQVTCASQCFHLHQRVHVVFSFVQHSRSNQEFVANVFVASEISSQMCMQ